MANKKSEDTSLQLLTLQRHLGIARDEINNLRKEIKMLKHLQRKDMSTIKDAVDSWKCSSCRSINTSKEHEPVTLNDGSSTSIESQDQIMTLKPIGYINTGFVQKRAIPRQPNMNLKSSGKISLCNFVFTNPEHSLESLGDFSHMWILFYFHKNHSTHVRPKVAPPRLNGARIGVFGSRSPHRPCPIGLSLVQIDRIEGSCIYFFGVDMLDGTPVLDIKPYIPSYDNPAQLNTDYPVGEREETEMDGQESDSEDPLTRPRPPSLMTTRPSEREAPDGEEGLSSSPPVSTVTPITTNVRVPDWVSESTSSCLQVTFSQLAESQISSLQEEEDIHSIIVDILRQDPRSVYLRDRYTNQFYTFLINNLHVSCKFDNNSRSVKVLRVTSGNTWCECGRPQWQCSVHGASTDI